MKTIITTVALAALIASPALAAQKKHSRHVSQEAFAQAQQWEPQSQPQRHSTNPSSDVYRNGRYMGSDPDPMIRFEIQRETSSMSE
jgi:hypothetical protein